MNDTNNSKLWVKGYRCDEQLKVLDNKNDSRLRAQGFSYYE